MIGYTKLVCVHINAKIYDFSIFERLGDLIRSIYYADIFLKKAMDKNINWEHY